MINLFLGQLLKSRIYQCISIGTTQANQFIKNDKQSSIVIDDTQSKLTLVNSYFEHDGGAASFTGSYILVNGGRFTGFDVFMKEDVKDIDTKCNKQCIQQYKNTKIIYLEPFVGL